MGNTGALPKTLLTNHFAELYGLEKEKADSEEEVRKGLVNRWTSLRIDMTNSPFDAECFEEAMRKLKGGKSSPDGVTAEMLKALPAEPMAALGGDLVRRCSRLEFPADWTERSATLAPKVAGASDLGKFRPIACLTTMRKLLGYMWLAALPPMTFATAQTAFIAGSHACMGVHALQRIAELSREWRLPVFIAQVDLRKAFDHIWHSAAIEAMRMQGCRCRRRLSWRSSGSRAR